MTINRLFEGLSKTIFDVIKMQRLAQSQNKSVCFEKFHWKKRNTTFVHLN